MLLITLWYFVFGALFTPMNDLENIYRVKKGVIQFESNAPLENITASTRSFKGLIDSDRRRFAFSVSITGFKGFNNPLQQIHFNENYMESHLFPSATFSGKIIEKIDFSKPGEYIIRAKGTLNIHGVKQERIIKSRLIIEGNTLKVKSIFSVLLKEHGIVIPKIVHQKIAKEILVSVDVVFEKQ